MSDTEQPNPNLSENPVRELETALDTDVASPDPFYRVRVQVVGLGIAFLILSLSFSAYVYKQNRSLRLLVETRSQQIKQIADALKQWTPAMNEFAGYSLTKPELAAIFARHGLQIGTNAPAAKAP